MTTPNSTIRQTLKPIIAVVHIILALFWAGLVPYFYLDLGFNREFYMLSDMAPIEAIVSQTREPAVYADGRYHHDTIRTRLRIRPLLGIWPAREIEVDESVNAVEGRSQFEKYANDPTGLSLIYVDTNEYRESFELLKPICLYDMGVGPHGNFGSPNSPFCFHFYRLSRC